MKVKGTPGGRTPAVETEAEYQQIITYLEDPEYFEQNTLPLLSPKLKKNFKRKANQFEIHVKDGNIWPEGKTLHFRVLNVDGSLRETKLYIPPWKKDEVLAGFHGADNVGGHFKRKKLHNLVRFINVYTINFSLFRSLKHILVSQKKIVWNSLRNVQHAKYDYYQIYQ